MKKVVDISQTDCSKKYKCKCSLMKFVEEMKVETIKWKMAEMQVFFPNSA